MTVSTTTPKGEPAPRLHKAPACGARVSGRAPQLGINQTNQTE